MRARHDWLELLQTSGPFLTLPVVDRVFPEGVPAVAPLTRARLRGAVETMMETHGVERGRAIDEVLDSVLDWSDHRVDDLPDALAAPVVEHRQVVRPDVAFRAEVSDEGAGGPDVAVTEAEDDDEEGAAAPVQGIQPWRLFGTVEAWGTHPLTRTTRDGWTASAAERLGVLLRAREVPVGLVTDGRWWAIVWAPRGGALGVAVWDATVFSEEPRSLASLAALLDRRRFLGVATENTLPRMLVESLQRNEELTVSLGRQVREAVELLLGKFDRLDADSGGRLLQGVDDDDVYAGIVTTMMRIVFLLFAEERRLLPSDDAIYSSAYSIGSLAEELGAYADLHGEQPLEHRTAAWHRLLATARAVHGGVHHEDLRLPAYGGEIFRPDRYPWLEGKKGATTGEVPAVDDRTVLRMLRAVQYVLVDGELRRLTFRALGVEQIGYVYEGLLELEVRTAAELTLQLVRPREWPRGKLPAEVPLSEAAQWVDELPETFAKQVKDRTGWSASKVERVLRDHLDEHVLAAAIPDLEPEAFKVALTLAPALRRDDGQRPVVVRPGQRHLAPSVRRASTGAHYTPPELAEEIVTGALEPLVYRPGPLQTADRSTWRVRPASELLDLRIADIAMGSGVFLVSACRYLADRVVESEATAGSEDAVRHLRSAATTDAEVPPVLLGARRRVVERCLYGVDVNPLAVEMAKLSLWLVTMDRERPFDFLDDRLVDGDSLLGLVDVEQLATLHVDPAAGRRLHHGGFDFADGWRKTLEGAADTRRRITDHGVASMRDVEWKQRLLREASASTRTLDAVADRLTGVALRQARTTKLSTIDNAFIVLSIEVGHRLQEPGELEAAADQDLQLDRPTGRAPRSPLHWPIAFPEVFVDVPRPGFDAIVGNPPFLGGQKHRGALGPDVAAYYQKWDGGGTKGSADLAARFVLRAQRLLSDRGQLAYIATNTLVQGDTLEVGLAQAVERGLTIRCGSTSHRWPTSSANLEIVNLWASNAPVDAAAERRLDGEPVPQIGADLEPVGRVSGPKYRLAENDGIAFIGSYVLGLGFTMSEEEARDLIARDPRNAEALQPYVIGQDLNQRPDCSASRWVINFRDWSLERAETYPDLIDIVRRKVKPEREKNNRANYRDRWWLYGENRPGLYSSLSNIDSVTAMARVSSSLAPAIVPTDRVYSEKVVVFLDASAQTFALLASSVHFCWAVRYTSTMRSDVNYAPSDVFATFPRPVASSELKRLGERLDHERGWLMQGKGWGLTKTYNALHDPSNEDVAVKNLRRLHEEIDHATLDAYGWSDLVPTLGIGHHTTKLGMRWTVCPDARFELLDRLLEENQRRHALEVGG